MNYPNNKILPMIDLEISGECNLQCPTCWGTPHYMKQEYSLSKWLHLLKDLKELFGLTGVALSGGEPLLVEGIDDFIIETKSSLELNVNLLTNTLNLPKYFSRIKPFLSTISIPLDSSSEENSRELRGEECHRSALKWIAYLNNEHLDLPLKVGSVVSSLNIEDIPDIGELLLGCGMQRRYPEKDVWKLYQATAFGAEQNNPLWQELRITENVFKKAVQKTRKRYEGKINLTELATSETGGYCIIIRPNGSVVTNSKEDGREYRLFENIFEDLDGAMEAIKKYHEVGRGVERLKSSYFSQGLEKL
ncbi:MAG: radical SAM protein [archaeon]